MWQGITTKRIGRLRGLILQEEPNFEQTLDAAVFNELIEGYATEEGRKYVEREADLNANEYACAVGQPVPDLSVRT